jgi:hypothetical protein
VVGKGEPGCGLPAALSFKDVHHPCWGQGQAELGPYLPHGLATHFFLQHSGEKGVNQLGGGGELPPAARSGCGSPSTARATVAQHVVRREGGVRVLGQSRPCSCGEDGSEDLPVCTRATAIRRCGVGAQVAAVVGAEVVVAIGEASPCRSGCLRRRDRQRHLWPDLRLFGFNGLSSPLVWGTGTMAFSQ